MPQIFPRTITDHQTTLSNHQHSDDVQCVVAKSGKKIESEAGQLGDAQVHSFLHSFMAIVTVYSVAVQLKVITVLRS